MAVMKWLWGVLLILSAGSSFTLHVYHNYPVINTIICEEVEVFCDSCSQADLGGAVFFLFLLNIVMRIVFALKTDNGHDSRHRMTNLVQVEFLSFSFFF